MLPSSGGKYFAGVIGEIAVGYEYLSAAPAIAFCRSWRAVPLGLSVRAHADARSKEPFHSAGFQTATAWVTVQIKNHKALLPWGQLCRRLRGLTWQPLPPDSSSGERPRLAGRGRTAIHFLFA